MDRKLWSQAVGALALGVLALGFLWVGCGSDNEGLESICGDDIVEPGEECDDGNLNDGDGCSSLCLIQEIPATPTPTRPPNQPPPQNQPTSAPTARPPTCRTSVGDDPGDSGEPNEFATGVDDDGDSDVFCS